MSNNTAVVFFKLYDTDYKNFHLVPSMKFALMTIEVCQRYDPPNKVVAVIDMKEVNRRVIANFNNVNCMLVALFDALDMLSNRCSSEVPLISARSHAIENQRGSRAKHQFSVLSNTDPGASVHKTRVDGNGEKLKFVEMKECLVRF
jgi:hypothetical protein